VRPNNEDAYYAGPRLLAVADGVGGHAAGEVASAKIIEALAASRATTSSACCSPRWSRATRRSPSA
jgi:PPM family protein phosphatase